MTISDTNREFIDNLINYYISESSAYKQIAEQYSPEIESVADAAFGIITGCIYASFLETCRNQQIQLELEDMTEFNKMIKERAAEIKKAIIDPASVGSNHTTQISAAKSQKDSKENNMPSTTKSQDRTEKDKDNITVHSSNIQMQNTHKVNSKNVQDENTKYTNNYKDSTKYKNDF